MMRRVLAAGIALIVSATSLVLGPGLATGLSCVPDDDDLAFEQMIDQRTTGEDRFPIMILGIVRSTKDMGGDPTGGRTTARLEVVEHPAGYAPPDMRIRFWHDFPGTSSFEVGFVEGARYVLVARRLDDGSFKSDGACGQSKRMNHPRFRELVRYARSR
jgi:hypothetical protein